MNIPVQPLPMYGCRVSPTASNFILHGVLWMWITAEPLSLVAPVPSMVARRLVAASVK